MVETSNLDAASCASHQPYRIEWQKYTKNDLASVASYIFCMNLATNSNDDAYEAQKIQVFSHLNWGSEKHMQRQQSK